MKRIAIIALTFILAGCIMTGCRRNDMQQNNGTDTSTGTEGGSTVTTIPDVTVLPQPGTQNGDNGSGSGPMDGSAGNDGSMPRGRISGQGQ